MAHQHLALAGGEDLVARRIPHHAGAKARIAEGFEQGLGLLAAAIIDLVETERALQPVDHRTPQRQALDPLGGPVGAHLVARHAPHLLGVGLEEDRIEFLAELVGGPVLKALHLADREQLVLQVARHAQGGAPQAQIPQRLEGAQRIGVELALVIDAAHARALDEVVGQDLVPQVDDLLALREEAMPTDIEAVALIFDGAADAANIGLVLFDDRDGLARLGQQISRRQSGRAGTDNGHVDIDAVARNSVGTMHDFPR